MKEDPIEEIQRIMSREGATEADLVKRGFNRTAIWKILRGINVPTWRSIQAIAKALGYRAYIHFRKERK